MVYVFLLPFNMYAMQRATRSLKPKTIKPKPANLSPIKAPTQLITAPIKTPKIPSPLEKNNPLLPSQSIKINLPKEFSAQSWPAIDLLDPTPTNIIEALNNNTQPTTDSLNAMINAQKANKFRVGFITDELVTNLGKQAELLFPKNPDEWFTLKNESGETIFESRPLPEGYMFLKKLGKDSELLILGEQTSSLKNSMEQLHIPADLHSKFLQTSAETFNKFFNTELKQVERIESTIAEKELAKAKQEGTVVDNNELQPQTDVTSQLLAQKDNVLFNEMADSGLYNDSSYLKNNQEKLARLRSIPANAESAENFFEQLQENFEKKKVKAAKKSAKIAAEKTQKAEIEHKKETQVLEQKKQEYQLKIATLSQEIQEAQKMLEQEIIIKNQLNKEAQLKAQEEFLQRQTDADYEQLIKELTDIKQLEKEITDTNSTLEQLQTEIEAQELLAQRNQQEQEKIGLQIAEDEAALKQINQEINVIQQARENIQTIKQEELNAANLQYDKALESEKQAILQQLQHSKDQLSTTQTSNSSSNTKQLQEWDLSEKNTLTELEQKKQELDTIEKNRISEDARLENEEKELKLQQDNLKKITTQKHASEQAIKDAQQEILQNQHILFAAQENATQTLYNLEQAHQEGIAAQALVKDTPEEKPLTGISKFIPKINQETQSIPAYTIPELLSTTPIDNPIVEEFIPQEQDTFVTAQQRPLPASSSTNIPAPSYNNIAQTPWAAKPWQSSSVATQTNQSTVPQATSTPQQPTVRNQGLSIPSFNQKYGQQIINPAGVALRPGNITTHLNTTFNNTSPYSLNEPATHTQQPESNLPTDMPLSLSSSTNKQPSYNSRQTQQDAGAVPPSLRQASDEKYVYNQQLATVPQQLGKKTINKNQSTGQKTITAESAQKSIHWLWRLITFIINWVKKLLHSS